MNWPAVVAALAFLAGAGLSVGAVYMLCGAGWAMAAGAAVCFFVCWLIERGLD